MTDHLHGRLHADAALTLLESLSDEALGEIMDLLTEGNTVWAIRRAHEASGPDHSLAAAITAIGMFYVP